MKDRRFQFCSPQEKWRRLYREHCRDFEKWLSFEDVYKEACGDLFTVLGQTDIRFSEIDRLIHKKTEVVLCEKIRASIQQKRRRDIPLGSIDFQHIKYRGTLAVPGFVPKKNLEKKERVLMIIESTEDLNEVRLMLNALDSMDLVVSPYLVCLIDTTGKEEYSGSRIISLLNLQP